MEIPGILLMIMLGLRHGLDPDHIAVIDGISARYYQSKPLLARWTGTLFAIGHGTVITSVAVTISLFRHSWAFSENVWSVLELLPGLILIFVGILNLHTLLSKRRYAPKGIRSFFLPAKLQNSSHPLGILLIGFLFAMVFDTTTQAAAWTYTATSDISTLNAFILGLSFSIGMIITDTLDSRILYSLMTRYANNDPVISYRRNLGWIIVCISFITGGYKILSHLFPGVELDNAILTSLGTGFFVIMVLFYAFVWHSSRRSKKSTYGNQRPNEN